MNGTALDRAFENLEHALRELGKATCSEDLGFVHVEDWLDQFNPAKQPSDEEAYARFVLELLRFPSWKQILYKSIIKSFPLFCTYDGTLYRVTGASRMGDVWLNYPDKVDSYVLRVPVTGCSSWRKISNP